MNNVEPKLRLFVEVCSWYLGMWQWDHTTVVSDAAVDLIDLQIGVTAGRNWGSNYCLFYHKPLACEYFHSDMDGCLYSCVEFNRVET
jgi:hypothetical protein